jgi:hypothetical protein
MKSGHDRDRRLLNFLPPTMSSTSTSAVVNAERFLADRAAPICGLKIGKSFQQLRF